MPNVRQTFSITQTRDARIDTWFTGIVFKIKSIETRLTSRYPIMRRTSFTSSWTRITKTIPKLI